MDAGAVLCHVEEHGEAEDAARAKVRDGVLLLKSEAFDPVGMGNGRKTLVVEEGFDLVRMVVGGSALCAVAGLGDAPWCDFASSRLDFQLYQPT